MIRRVLIVLVVLVVLAGAGGAYVLTRRPIPGDRISLEIPRGSSTIRIAQLLEEHEVIGSTTGFRVMSRVRGMDGEFRAGTYELRHGMGVQAALDALAAGPIDRSMALTIPEGYTVKQIAARVGEQTHITEEEFLEAATSGEVTASIQPQDVKSLEGFLFPDTYAIGDRETGAGLVGRMVDEFESRIGQLDWSQADDAGLTRYEVLILASLVEREAKLDEDRAMVSAVIYNRLRIGMRLQIDITTNYDAPEHKVPTRQDRRRQSPYNTYLNDGLPPTPIANPGMESLRAAVAPASTDAIYYVVIDPSGKHGFTADHDEFLRLSRLCPPVSCARR